RYMLHALRRGARQVTGVDLSPQMLHRAGAELAQDWPAARIVLQQGSLDQLPLADTVADLSVCGLVLGHLQQLWPALEE
ncbi:class I SAM-dependent methyltransferase, partial [Xanthomonas citri]